jgi:heat shock protein HtpX
VTTSTVCARCDTPLVTLHDAPPWCPACEAGLLRFDPAHHRYVGVKFVDRRLYAFAARRAARAYAAPADHPAVLSNVIAVLYYAVLIAVAALLVRWSAGAFPSWRLVVTLPLLVVLVVVVWPRFDPLDRDASVVRRADAPALYGLVDRVAAAVGTPVPDLIVASSAYTAEAGRRGLRGRRVLVLGMPLWQGLTEAQQIALVAHHLGHFAGHDPRAGRLIGPVEASLVRLATVLRPTRSRMLEPIRDPTVVAAVAGSYRGSIVSQNGLLVVVSELIWAAIANTLRAFVTLTRLALIVAVQPMSHRAAYLADELGARAAGTAAMVEVLDLLLLKTLVLTRLNAAARVGGGPDNWWRIAEEVLANAHDTLPARRQQSIRTDESPFADHPPLGLRVRKLLAQPASAETVESAPDERVHIDDELARYARRAQRDF